MEERHEKTARAIITIGGQVLLARGKQDPFSHLPGGHCELGEEPTQTLARELQEESGRIISSIEPIMVMNNVFDKGSTRIREEMHLFRVKLYPELQEHPPRSREDHLEFKWVPIQDLDRVNLQPKALHEVIQTYGGL